MSENSTPITLQEQIRYCEEEAARWRHVATRTTPQWAEAQVRHDYYCAIATSLRYLQERHDLLTTQEIEPVEVRNDK